MTLTFELEYEDGSNTQIVVPLSFDDVPGEVMAEILEAVSPSDLVGVATRLVAYRLSVPLEAAVRLVDGLNRGEGIRVPDNG
jgi:hypothetical protein